MSKPKPINDGTCHKPDRHAPRMVCGYPLPCPFHTVVADVESQTVAMPLGDGSALVLPAAEAGRVGDIAQALRQKKHKR